MQPLNGMKKKVSKRKDKNAIFEPITKRETLASVSGGAYKKIRRYWAREGAIR